VPYNDSGCLTELPADDFEAVMRELEGVRVKIDLGSHPSRYTRGLRRQLIFGCPGFQSILLTSGFPPCSVPKAQNENRLRILNKNLVDNSIVAVNYLPNLSIIHFRNYGVLFRENLPG